MTMSYIDASQDYYRDRFSDEDFEVVDLNKQPQELLGQAEIEINSGQKLLGYTSTPDGSGLVVSHLFNDSDSINFEEDSVEIQKREA